MAIHSSAYQTIKDYHEQVMEIDDPNVIRLAQHIAYYAAMLNAAEEDPMENADDHAELMEFMKAQQTIFVELYQTLVNEKL